jgi:hypothetical protein
MGFERTGQPSLAVLGPALKMMARSILTGAICLNSAKLCYSFPE